MRVRSPLSSTVVAIARLPLPRRRFLAHVPLPVESALRLIIPRARLIFGAGYEWPVSSFGIFVNQWLGMVRVAF
jgi:hypothetical protein